MRLHLIIVALLAAPMALGQQYPFLAVPGSPRNVQSVYQDAKGRLWIIPDLTFFDGTRFFNLRDYGFPAVKTYGVREDSYGGIWIAAATGVYRFAEGKVELVSRGTAMSVFSIGNEMAVALMPSSGLNVLQDKKLVRIRRDGKVWTSEFVMDLHSPGYMDSDGKGDLLYPINTMQWGEIRMQDLVHWTFGGTPLRIIRHGASSGAALSEPAVVTRDRVGCMWMGQRGGGWKYDCGAGWKAVVFPSASITGSIDSLRDGRMVVGGTSMLAIGRPGSFWTSTSANGLPPVYDTVLGIDGTIWVTSPDGLYRFSTPTKTEYWTAREGVTDSPWSFTRIGSRMFAGMAGKIVVLSEDRSHWKPFSTLPNTGAVMALSPTLDGNLLAGLQKGEAVELGPNGSVIARLPAREGIAERFTTTPDGKIWMGGTHLGTLSRQGSTLRLDRQPLATDAGKVLSIRYEGRTRRLWSCYGGGLVLREEHGAWKEFTTKNGLRVNGCWSLAPLPNGDVWYSYYVYPGFALIHPTTDGGIHVRNYDRKTLPDPSGLTLDLDRQGRLWRSGEQGIYVADPQQAEAANWLQLDRNDGLPADDMNSGSVFVDTDGSLWWGADNKVAHYFPPADLVKPKFAPQVYVSAFSWEGQAPRLAEAIRDVPHGAHLVAHIGSLQFDRRNALQVRYRLSHSEAWKETKSLDLALGEQGQGAHTLEVQGRVYTGPWSATQKATFTVLPPGWLGTPYLAGYSALLLLLAGAAYFLHRQRELDEAQLLPNIATWRLEALTPDVQHLAGVVLDSRFLVGSLLARGGFATVMAGYDQRRGERCAIKIFRTDVKDKGWMQRGFELEIAALRKVRHPNVVRITAHGRTPQGAPYLSMEFIEGRSLRDVLAEGPLTPERAANILEQLSAALEAIHAEDICHRDLKPENILLRGENTAEEQAVLIDFSIAIIKDADEALHGISRAAGTFDYMAPEQAVGHAQPASDIYSLARVLIEMLTGRKVKELLPGASLDLPRQVVRLLRKLRLPLTEESIEKVAAALEFDPMRRPFSAREFSGTIVSDLRLKSAKRTS